MAVAPPESRRGGDLRRPRVMDPDRNLAKLVVQSMDEIFAFYGNDMQALVDWAIQSDPLYVFLVNRRILELTGSADKALVLLLQSNGKLLALKNRIRSTSPERFKSYM